MQLPRILRAHPWVSLVATLAIVLVLIGFWPQLSKALVLSHSVPPYPGAQNLSHEIPWEHGERLHTCWRRGEETRSHTRITQFETSDSPDIVLQFYTATLVDRGPYELVDREHRGSIGYGRDRTNSDDGERGIFEHDTYRDTTEFAYHVADGYSVVIDAAPGVGHTTVQLVTSEYARFSRACHP